MSGNPTSFARRRSSSSSSQERHSRDQLLVSIDSGATLDADQSIHAPLIEDLDQFLSADDGDDVAPSSSKGKKGRGRNLKALRPPENRKARKWAKLTPNRREFADPTIPRAITALWKSCFDGPYFTFERVPHRKFNEIYNCFKALYQWPPKDNVYVRNAFLNCMKHRWSDTLNHERKKWEKDPTYIPCWVSTHVWTQLQAYWKFDEFKIFSDRGARNRGARERVTHTTGSISFSIHEMGMTESRGGVQPPHHEKYKETHTFRKKVTKGQEPAWINEKAKHRHDAYVTACTKSHGPDVTLWPYRDNEAWANVVGGCSSNFIPGIGSQVNPEDVGSTYKKIHPRDNLMTMMMMTDFAKEQARQNELMAKQNKELERQREQMTLMQQQLAQMTQAQNNMSQTIAQSIAAALAAYVIHPPVGHHPFGLPQAQQSQGSSLHSNTLFSRSSDSTQTSPILP